MPFWTSRIVCQLLAVVDALQMLYNVGDVTQTTPMMMMFVFVTVTVIVIVVSRVWLGDGYNTILLQDNTQVRGMIVGEGSAHFTR